MRLSRRAIVLALTAPPCIARFLHLLPHNDLNAAFRVDFWSGIACSGVHTGNFSGPSRNLSIALPRFRSCERIPYPGITGAVTFRGDEDYFFRLHADPTCDDEQVAVGGHPNDTRICLRTGIVRHAVAWSVRMNRNGSALPH